MGLGPWVLVNQEEDHLQLFAYILHIAYFFGGNLYSQTSVLQVQEVSSRRSGQIWSKNVFPFFVADILPVPGRNLEIATSPKNKKWNVLSLRAAMIVVASRSEKDPQRILLEQCSVHPLVGFLMRKTQLYGDKKNNIRIPLNQSL